MTSTELRYCRFRGVNVIVELSDVLNAQHDPVGLSVRCLNKEKECQWVAGHCELEQDA